MEIRSSKATLFLLALSLLGAGLLWSWPAGADVPPGESTPTVATGPEAGVARAVENDGTPVSISVTDGRIQDVLRTLAAMRPGTTIMIDPNVSGTVSFELQEVPWDLALQLVVDAQTLEVVRRSENVFLVQPATIRVEDERDLVVELFTREEILALADPQLRAMYAGDRELPEDLTVAEIRERVAQQPEFYVKRLSVTNRNAIEVLNHLTRSSNVDFVFSAHFEPETSPQREEPAARGRTAAESATPISLNIRNRSIPVAIRLIAEQGGLSATLQDGIWIVKPLRPEQVALEPLITRTFRVRYIPIDDKLLSDLDRLNSDRGKVIARGKTLTVFDTADRIEQVERILADQDLPTPQVLIEARFFVLNDTTSHELGINWQQLTTPAAEDGGLGISLDPRPLTYGYEGGNLFGGEILGPIDAATGEFVDPRFLSDPGTLGKLMDPGMIDPSQLPAGVIPIDPRTATLTLPQLSAVLHALDNMDNAKQLSNPKIIVSSDEQATIHIGRQEPIIKSSIDNSGQTPITTFELDTNFGGETVQVADLLSDRPGRSTHTTSYTGYTGYLDLGTKLTVAPSVKTEDEVYIRVIPELINRPSQIVLNQQTFPILFRVRVQTQFNLRSGQTVAIGGLVSENQEQVRKALPLLGKIPLLGSLFRYTGERLVRSETIIFLTVRVIWPEELDTISAVPVNARSVQSEIDNIRRQDAEGGVYNEEAMRELQRMIEADKESRNFLRRLLKGDREPELEEAEAPSEPEAPDADIEPEPEIESPDME